MLDPKSRSDRLLLKEAIEILSDGLDAFSKLRRVEGTDQYDIIIKSGSPPDNYYRGKWIEGGFV